MNRRSVAPCEVFRSSFRPFALSESQLPVSVRSAGFYSVGQDWSDAPMRKQFCELFWCVSGKGRFEIDGKSCVLNAGEAIALYPGEWHLIRSDGPWSYHWMTFDGPLSESIFRKLPASRLFKSGPCPEGLFERAEELLQSPEMPSQFMATATGLEIICAALAGTRKLPEAKAEEGEDFLFKMALQAIDESWQDASFDVTRLAQRLGMHRTTLSRLFVRKLQTPPLKYLKAKRLQKALLMIKGSRLPVLEMAGLCGFASAAYFTRTVRQATGMTPGQLRREHGR